ncbi:MAG: FAD:protein FMN transferase [Planctomycetota bacterium]
MAAQQTLPGINMKTLATALLLILTSCTALRADEAQILQIVGPTMGTKYTVKVFRPEAMAVEPKDLQIQIDGLLRRINDQMSTYLDHSEISRFNQSSSLDWVEVSADFATVVQFALKVAEQSDGALDVTVGPLVNAWNFGPEPRDTEPPSESVLAELSEYVGFEKLSVRMDPPALKKSHPNVRVDLSSIAKGFAVDKVVALLDEQGAKNVFVEIGGEVRTAGSKDGQWWKVGIQLPDAASDVVMIAHSLNTGSDGDQAMATSGDYRNYFESDGVRYSHTIDPATSRPITHSLASVSVVADSCMAADAWATALNVLGADRADALAKREGLSVLLINRSDDGFEIRGTGTLAQYSSDSNRNQAAGAAVEQGDANADGNSLLVVLAITFVAFTVVLFGMAIGVIFGRRSISGSCGGLANTKSDDGSVSCALCSNPDNACKELRERMESTPQKVM